MDIPLLKKIAAEFNACLSHSKYKHLPFREPFALNDLMNGVKVITNGSGSDKLIKLFFNNFIPKSRRRIYHHFTTLTALKSIIKSEHLWLSAVSKRFGEKEFKPFYKAHQMDGYEKRQTPLGISLDRDICDNSFFLSLTGNNISRNTEQLLTTAFSDNKKGVRMVFSMTKIKTDVRKVYYHRIKSMKKSICLKSSMQ